MMESWQRIYGLLLRHFYVLRSSPARLAEVIYWPSVQMILWGFISQFFAHQSANTVGYALGTLLGAVILWDFLFRSQLGVTFAYLDEVWARNLGHLFVSPLRPYEWWISMMLYSIVRALIGMVPAALLAIPFYGFSIFDMGLPVLFLFFNLMMMGWWLGLLINSILLKVGQGAETVAWGLTFFLAPFCAVYYPVSTLPEWIQPLSLAMPAAHVFEGLRALVQTGTLEIRHIVMAFGLNMLYMALAVFIAGVSFNNARKAGTLLQAGT